MRGNFSPFTPNSAGMAESPSFDHTATKSSLCAEFHSHTLPALLAILVEGKASAAGGGEVDVLSEAQSERLAPSLSPAPETVSSPQRQQPSSLARQPPRTPKPKVVLVYQFFGQCDLLDFVSAKTAVSWSAHSGSPAQLSLSASSRGGGCGWLVVLGCCAQLPPLFKRKLQLATALLLHALHCAGVAHLDFTPENILVHDPTGWSSTEGFQLQLRLCDFSKAAPLFNWSPLRLPFSPEPLRRAESLHARRRVPSQETVSGPTAALPAEPPPPFLSCEPTVAKGPYMPPECWEALKKLRYLGGVVVFLGGVGFSLSVWGDASSGAEVGEGVVWRVVSQGS